MDDHSMLEGMHEGRTYRMGSEDPHRGDERQIRVPNGNYSEGYFVARRNLSEGAARDSDH